MQDGGGRHLGFSHFFTFDVNVEMCTAQSNLMSSVVKIGAMVPKLHCFFSIQDGGRRHLGFYNNLEYN